MDELPWCEVGQHKIEWMAGCCANCGRRLCKNHIRYPGRGILGDYVSCARCVEIVYTMNVAWWDEWRKKHCLY